MKYRARFWIVLGSLVSLIRVGPVAADLGVPISAIQPLNTSAGGDAGDDRSPPRIVPDGQGGWLAAWFARGSAGGTTGTDNDILLARSVDAGANWSNPTPLNNDAGSDQAFDLFPALATDRQGRWVAAWARTDGADSDIFFARSIDNGNHWSTPAPLNAIAATGVSAASPSVATDGHGNWVVAWNSADSLGNTIGTEGDILVSRSTDNGASWTDPVPLNTNAGMDTGGDGYVDIVTDGLGVWLAVWQSNDPLGNSIGPDNNILFARSLNNGVSWTAPAALNSNAASDVADDEHARIATDGAGNWVAVWQTDEILVAHSIDNGANWSSPAPLNAGAADDRLQPHVATEGAGNWIAVWADEHIVGPNDYTIDILLSRSIDNGANWSSPAKVPGDAGHDSDDEPFAAIATDGFGQWVVAWQSQGKLGDDYDLFSVRFGFPDCNSNLIGDPTETAAGISPDINGNNVPDSCDIFPSQPTGGCGGGLCGGGMVALAPITLAGIACMARAVRRKS